MTGRRPASDFAYEHRLAATSGDGWSEEAGRWRRRAALASVTVAGLLAVTKLSAALVTGSVAVLSSLVDSLADIAASLITLVSVRLALRPPTVSHRFGHGKAEALSALAQAAFIAGSGLFIIVDAARRLIDPQPIQAPWLGVAAMVLSIVLTAGLVVFQQRVIRLSGSQAIAADRLHYTGDLLAAVSVIVALGMVHWTGIVWVDQVAGLGIAAYLLWNARRIGLDAVRTLMDREMPDEYRGRVEAVVLRHPSVRGLHDLRTRGSSLGEFIEFHLELDGSLPLWRAHEITDAVEGAVTAAFPAAQVVIHQEPAGLLDERLDHQLASE